jgi:hypothetical protein
MSRTSAIWGNTGPRQLKACLLLALLPILVSCDGGTKVRDALNSPPLPPQFSCSKFVIKTPKQGGSVRLNDNIDGTISSSAPELEVWAVIHPDRDRQRANAPGYWVQRAGAASDGKWISRVNFGEENTPEGYWFEVQAFVAPTPPVREGDMLPGFPQDAACKSNIVKVFLRR